MAFHTGRSYAQQKSVRDAWHQLTYNSGFKKLSAIKVLPFAKKPQDGEASRLLSVLLIFLPIIEKMSGREQRTEKNEQKASFV